MRSLNRSLPFLSVFGPALDGSFDFTQQTKELIDFAGRLSGEQKMIAEYWRIDRIQTCRRPLDLFPQCVRFR
jgi:hypothetical protein